MEDKLIFKHIRENEEIRITSIDPVHISEYINAFGHFLLAIGFHPDNVDERLGEGWKEPEIWDK